MASRNELSSASSFNVPFVSSSRSSSRASSLRKLPMLPSRDIAAMRRKIRLASSSWQIASSDSMSFSHSPSMSPVQRPRRGTRYALLRDFLQRLDQLLELGLVREGDF